MKVPATESYRIISTYFEPWNMESPHPQSRRDIQLTLYKSD